MQLDWVVSMSFSSHVMSFTCNLLHYCLQALVKTKIGKLLHKSAKTGSKGWGGIIIFISIYCVGGYSKTIFK